MEHCDLQQSAQWEEGYPLRQRVYGTFHEAYGVAPLTVLVYILVVAN